VAEKLAGVKTSISGEQTVYFTDKDANLNKLVVVEDLQEGRVD